MFATYSPPIVYNFSLVPTRIVIFLAHTIFVQLLPSIGIRDMDIYPMFRLGILETKVDSTVNVQSHLLYACLSS